MNGIHDMGGMHGFGRVDARGKRARLPRAWEGRVARDHRGVQRAAASSTSTRAVTRSSGWRRSTTSARATTSAGSIATCDCSSRRAWITREELRAPHGPAGRRSDPAPPHSDPKLLDRMLRATKERTPHPPARAAAALRARRPHLDAAATRPVGTRGCLPLRARQARRHRHACTARSSSRTPTPTVRASSPTRSTACASTPPISGARRPSPCAPVHHRSLGALPRARVTAPGREHVMSDAHRRSRPSSPRA